jgi:hypothetical protein
MTYNILFTSLFLSILIIIVLIIIYRKEIKRVQELSYKKITLENLKKEEIKEYFKKEWSEEEKNLEDKIRIKREGVEKTFKDRINFLETNLKEKEKRYNEVNQDLDLYKKGRIEEIDKTAAEYERSKRLENAQAIEEHNNSMKKASAELQEQLKRSENILKEQIEKIKIELEAEQSKRDAINEEILRQRKVEEEQDFYRIQIDSDDKNDVEILRSIAPRLRHPEAINKVIWTGYYQKPLAELRKRLLSNGDISGIYKITRMKTKEIYIGQSTSIDKRWQEHVKTALGVGNLASSQFHRVMAKDGPENFFFEILEETKKDKLREREAYYIQWFRSDKFGLNSNSGDKNK